MAADTTLAIIGPYQSGCSPFIARINPLISADSALVRIERSLCLVAKLLMVLLETPNRRAISLGDCPSASISRIYSSRLPLHSLQRSAFTPAVFTPMPPPSEQGVRFNEHRAQA